MDGEHALVSAMSLHFGSIDIEVDRSSVILRSSTMEPCATESGTDRWKVKPNRGAAFGASKGFTKLQCAKSAAFSLDLHRVPQRTRPTPSVIGFESLWKVVSSWSSPGTQVPDCSGAQESWLAYRNDW